MEKLIIIRGPSGAGKSSVARALLEESKRPTLLVSVDQIRKSFSDQSKPDHRTTKDLTTNNVLFGLSNGYNVVLEGILNIKTDTPYLDKILKAHPKENYFFYLDVSYEETLRRHKGRPEKKLFGEAEMREWRGWATPTGHPSETIIPEDSSLEETVSLVQKTAGI